MKIHGVIYGLHDPQTGELRYIGQTVTEVVQRLRTHLAPSQLKRHSYLARWLLSLVKRGLSPTWSQIVTAQNQVELDQLEIEHIAKARAEGVRLVNLSAGGGGRAGYKVPAHVIEKIAAKQRGVPRKKHTPEWREHMAQVMAGRCNNTPEHMEHLRQMKLGVPRSSETRAKISVAKKGQPSPKRGVPLSGETRAKISESRKGQLLGKQHHQYRHDISPDYILQRLSEGATKVQIAAELGVTRTLVLQRVQQALGAGRVIPKCKRLLPKRGPLSAEHRAKLSAARKDRFRGEQHPGWKDVPVSQILDKMSQGLGRQAIAKTFGVSVTTVRRKLRQAGHGPTKIEVPMGRVFQRLTEGATVRAISNELGLPYMSVWRRVQKTKEAA